MGRYLQPGHEYQDGQTISGPSLTEHVSEAILKPTTISEQILKDPAALTDELLINDAGTFKKVTLQQIRALLESLAGVVELDEIAQNARIPTGSIIEYAGITEPEGWLFCDGQWVLRETYATLFAAIGTTWGSGDGSTSFALPDLRGFVTAHRDSTGGRLPDTLVPYGRGSPNALNSYCGAPTVQLTESQIPAHAHFLTEYSARLQTGIPGANTPTGGVPMIQFNVVDTAIFGQNTNTTGGNGAHHNVQFTMIVNKIIRYL